MSDIKICKSCKLECPLSFFSKNKKYADGLEAKCKSCLSKERKISRDNNLEKRRADGRARNKANRQWLALLKLDQPCFDCGKIYEPFCMDYDHLKDKTKSITRMVKENAPKERILEEIKKCDLVCILCHNDRTKHRLDEKFPIKKYRKHQLRNIEIINKAKDVPCAECGIKYLPHNMQFDHIDPNTKYKNICQLKDVQVEVLLLEIAKCRVLCALCHRRKSIIEQDEQKYPTTREKIPPQRSIIDEENKLKECYMCKQILPWDKFHYDEDLKYKLSTYCKECISQYARERRKSSNE